MIDESDGNFALLMGMGGGWVWALICIFIAIALYVTAAQNADECAERQCKNGHGKLLDHECVCVEEAQ